MAMGMGHEDGGTKKGWVGSKNLPKNDMDECDKHEEMNPIDLVCFNLFMFLSPRVRYSRVLQTRVCPVL